MAVATGNSFASRFGVHIAVLVFVAIWTIPTLGILVSSLRDKDQIVASGWWNSFASSSQTEAGRLPAASAQTQKDGKFVLEGNIFGDGVKRNISAFGVKAAAPTQYPAGTSADLGDGVTLQVNADGSFVMASPKAFEGDRGQRVYYASSAPPKFTTDNYQTVLFSEGIGRSFMNSLTVTIPATVIPILIAAFAAYALAWMRFPGRALLIAVIIGLLVVPLQMSLIPLLRLYNGVGTFFGVPSKTYLGIWLAHTGFGLPFAIYLLRSYIAGLPREIMESARIDGASDFEIFVKIVLPLSFPVLASFAIFQFLWVWNDLLVAMVFLGTAPDQIVLTAKLNALLGSRGGNWEILTTSAFITIIVPLIVFFSLQRYFVRGLLAGSVKGG
ncbi:MULTISPECIES: carbohydrate ABC transporter permease [unclassified Mesorhizobium]|uniref:carbohydrate ABC transporter permease n=1 Tax=unclassified Mesorhizobium TaxID=325217 RepID=UPI000FCA8AA4|nr:MULTISPECIES: carbohydrate ABC transporter permease [unclassified Mesorhizobium]RUX02713.1 carbohydrate ABC transporter permease [Mesorhizobium sp. M8A.F.Ca.ET.023.01.1.1]RVD50928.1 carbohydrate ABC transporter permease [Mesorhizobium sp. M8A.F.Ca.ET.023.02.2.1]RUW56545.1 carbohydrate ABC transporter permease [Mesorhizobium sp. M8A.F.Ca.ET.021.01.1.1]RWC68142.1 MAG: carbohydrate ABC transporter permease [Mesorhizobium sp.]RWC74821.1 MAG: carbohydrate ABC transporter permease [Mesorhizobium 